MDSPPPDRVIHIYVKDSKHRLIAGATIRYTMDDLPAGDVENSDGHADFQIGDRAARITVSATVRGKTQTAALAQMQDEYTFFFNVDRRALIRIAIGLGFLAAILFLVNRNIIPIGRSPFEIQSGYASDLPRREEVCVVFVHGLFGSRENSWLNASVTFPRLLASDPAFNRVTDVFVFEYYTPYFGNAASIVELADQLRGALEDNRVFDHRRVVFLGHSMGGLVVRQLLLTNRHLISRVPMLFFYATPTDGSELASVARQVSNNPQLRGMLPIDGNDLLQSIQSGWLGWPDAVNTPSYCSYELLPTAGLIVVSKSSSTALCNRPLGPIAASHIDMVKPSSRSDDRYTRLATPLQRLLGETKSSDKAENGNTRLGKFLLSSWSFVGRGVTSRAFARR